MGYTLNIIIFAICFSFMLSLFFVNGSSCTSASTDATSAGNTLLTSVANFFGTTQGQAAIAAGAGSILLGTLFFPNPWLIFLGPTIVIYGFVNYLNNLFYQCNPGINNAYFTTIQGLFALIIVLEFTLALLSWFKGGPDM